MAQRLAISAAEILDALASAAKGSAPSEAKTVRELQDVMGGIHHQRVRDALHILAAQGRLGVHRVTRTALDGRSSSVPAYTILPKKR